MKCLEKKKGGQSTKYEAPLESQTVTRKYPSSKASIKEKTILDADELDLLTEPTSIPSLVKLQEFTK
jgi:hypothetical protein